MSKLIFLTIIGLAASIAAAQGNSTAGSPATANGAFERIVTGLPFSAESITEVVQTAVDGSHLKRTTTAVVARDSHGRTRYSQNLSLLLPGGPRVLTFIRDPVAGVRYLMDTRETVARRELIPTSSPGRGSTSGGQFWNPEEAAIKVARQSVKSMLFTRSAALSQTVHSDATPLGDQVVDGVTASGARVTAVVAAGQIGNDKPLTFLSEAWYSPELSIIVMSKVSDPVTGDTNFQLTKLRRGEPNPDLFVVPAGYRIIGAGIPSEPGAQRAKE
jgi:hypothetical protein